MKTGYLRDFADGFLAAVDAISTIRYEKREHNLRDWEDYRENASPGTRAVQSYFLRGARRMKESGFVPDTMSVRHARRGLGNYGFSAGSFSFGQGWGNLAAVASAGLVPAGFYVFSRWERKKEGRVRKYFEKLQQEIDSI